MTIYSLYTKTHKKTGLKYLGFTKLDPFKYKGSGKYWKNHIHVHGYDVDTTVLLQTTEKPEIKTSGLYYSKLWNVVKSKSWANLKEEDGYGGSMPKHLRADTSGERNPRHISTEYDFYNIFTGQHIKTTRYIMTRDYGLNKCFAKSLVEGHMRDSDGWQMTPVKFYNFYHAETNTTVCMTRRGFAKVYNFRPSIIYEVIHKMNRRKSYKGWTVLIQE